jgi:hypothetical protein
MIAEHPGAPVSGSPGLFPSACFLPVVNDGIRRLRPVCAKQVRVPRNQLFADAGYDITESKIAGF